MIENETLPSSNRKGHTNILVIDRPTQLLAVCNEETLKTILFIQKDLGLIGVGSKSTKDQSLYFSKTF